jgi:uncharacterized protein with von Willebrand factor type A (vWA) domain
MSGLLNNLLAFGRVLRTLGLEVHLGRLLDVVAALQHVDIGARADVYHTCRALLVHRHDDLATFDRAFDAFWRIHVHTPGLEPPDTAHEHDRASERESEPGLAERDAAYDLAVLEDAPAEEEPSGALPTWSDVATLAHKDFAEFTPDEIALARAALDRLEWSPGERRTRRWVRGRGPRVDLRRALAQSVRTGGDVIRLPTRRRRTRPRPIVLLCDISGSMERYSRLVLHFAHAIGQRHRRVEAFVFSTQLTRVTSALRARRLDEAVSAVSRSVPDWSGGTRIGEALRHFHQRWTRRALHGGPVVLLISDGWDRGDPVLLREQIRRLQRGCHRLIWLNPLIGTDGYTPSTRGLQAALPFVDDFLPARTLTNFADLAIHLNSLQRRSWTSPAPTRSMRRPTASGPF